MRPLILVYLHYEVIEPRNRLSLISFWLFVPVNQFLEFLCMLWQALRRISFLIYIRDFWWRVLDVAFRDLLLTACVRVANLNRPRLCSTSSFVFPVKGFTWLTGWGQLRSPWRRNQLKKHCTSLLILLYPESADIATLTHLHSVRCCASILSLHGLLRTFCSQLREITRTYPAMMIRVRCFSQLSISLVHSFLLMHLCNESSSDAT